LLSYYCGQLADLLLRFEYLPVQSVGGAVAGSQKFTDVRTFILKVD